MINDNKSCGSPSDGKRTAAVQKTIYSLILTNRMHRKVIESWANGAGMHHSCHRMLMCLSKCEVCPSQKDLARRFEISPAAVTVTLRKLESDGYIERLKPADKNDSRFNEIKITERGRIAVKQSEKYFRQIDDVSLKGFSDSELETLMSFFERIQNNLKNAEPASNK